MALRPGDEPRRKMRMTPASILDQSTQVHLPTRKDSWRPIDLSADYVTAQLSASTVASRRPPLRRRRRTVVALPGGKRRRRRRCDVEGSSASSGAAETAPSAAGSCAKRTAAGGTERVTSTTRSWRSTTPHPAAPARPTAALPSYTLPHSNRSRNAVAAVRLRSAATASTSVVGWFPRGAAGELRPAPADPRCWRRYLRRPTVSTPSALPDDGGFQTWFCRRHAVIVSEYAACQPGVPWLAYYISVRQS